MKTFQLNDIEEQRANAFIEKHKTCRPKIEGLFPLYAPYQKRLRKIPNLQIGI